MQIVDKKITIAELKPMADKMSTRLVKAVVDIDKQIMAIDAPMHADQEMYLLENGSEQGNLWGINIFPEKYGTPDFIVFDSMINLRPGWGNRSRGVENPKIQEIIKKIVHKLVIP